MPLKVTAVLSLALLAGCGGSSDERAEPVDADTLVVYSSLPRSGGSQIVGDAVAAGQRLALSDAGGRVGSYTVKLVELDSAEPDERDWDPDRVAENASRAADDPAAIAYLGELELGASAVSLPVTNEERILQVSPTDGLTSLTIPQPGPGAGPERFYTEDERNFLRLVPPDSAQAGPLVAVARESGATRIAIAHDGGIFGRQLAGGVEQAASDQRVEVTTVERIEPELDKAPDALPPGKPAQPLPVVTPMLPARRYPAAGRRILARLAREGTKPPVEALYGYESMRVVLAALRAAGGHARDREAVIEAARASGSRGSVIGPYRFDRRGDTSLRRLALYELERGRLEYRGLAPGSAR